MKAAHDEVFRRKKLPSVGQIVRNRMYSTLWRVMEKREIWQHIAYDPQSGEGALLPAIYIAYWKIQKGVMPGIGKMIGYTYALHDNTFESNWNVVEDNGGRRLGIKRRQFSFTQHIPERRSGRDRRSGNDRRLKPRTCQ